MVQHTLIVAVDLGTSATTSSHTRVRDSFDNQGKLHREKLGSVSDVKDWPACIEGATRNNCVPTDLIYDRITRKLLFWGFEAQQYLDDPFHDIPKSSVFVVETIKLLLPDHNEAKIPSAASERYRAMRKTLMATLDKDPDEVFEDQLSAVLEHVIDNAIRKYSIGLHNHQIELILAFPSGWDDQIHATVARIGARALQKAISTHGLENMIFGIENVYTVSETLCSVKEWLRETVAEASSIDFETLTTNLDDLNEGDCFLPIDIGGGTGCLTPLKLVSKDPLGVEQLDRTKSLEVSGEAVEAEFERMLRSRITKKDYPGDMERAIYQICRKYKEEKKKCGTSLGSGSKTWNCPVTRLRANPRKGFEKDCMKFIRKHLEDCFDPVIDVLDRAIEETMCKFPSIKAIVFLGQFGGTSAYLQRRMANNPISRKVKIRHSHSGKLDVVKGAISERLTLEETFVRRFKTLKSYGTLVTLAYSDEVARIFPNPQAHGALPFERANDGPRLKVIEWALPKETIVQDGWARNIGQDGRRYHTWPFREDELGFVDIIIVSDEDVPVPQLDGRSYTLWTEDHQHNQLYIAGQRMRVKQIPFCWDLIMSQKLDAQGNIVGPYERDSLRTFWYPEGKVKDHRRKRLRELHYDLIWEITEMQVKLYVQAIFPKQVGSPLSQLAKEQALGPDEKTVTGESRSKALDKDIEIVKVANEEHDESDYEIDSEDQRRDDPRRIRSLVGTQQANGQPRQCQQSRASSSSSNSAAHKQTLQAKGSRLTSGQEQGQATAHRLIMNESQEQIEPLLDSAANGILRKSPISQDLQRHNTQSSAGGSPSSNSRKDGRRRDGCYTCKDRKKRCDCQYIFDETSGTHKCNTCLRVGLPCDMTGPDWAHDPVQRKIQQRERSRLVKLGKRKSREESESSGTASRDRSTTIAPADIGRRPTIHRSIETAPNGLSSQLTAQDPIHIQVRRGTFTAIRGRNFGPVWRSSKRAVEAVLSSSRPDAGVDN